MIADNNGQSMAACDDYHISIKTVAGEGGLPK